MKVSTPTEYFSTKGIAATVFLEVNPLQVYIGQAVEDSFACEVKVVCSISGWPEVYLVSLVSHPGLHCLNAVFVCAFLTAQKCLPFEVLQADFSSNLDDRGPDSCCCQGHAVSIPSMSELLLPLIAD